MSEYHTEKPKNVDYFQVPKALWKRIAKLFDQPKRPSVAGGDHQQIIRVRWCKKSDKWMALIFCSIEHFTDRYLSEHYALHLDNKLNRAINNHDYKF